MKKSVLKFKMPKYKLGDVVVVGDNTDYYAMGDFCDDNLIFSQATVVQADQNKNMWSYVVQGSNNECDTGQENFVLFIIEDDIICKL